MKQLMKRAREIIVLKDKLRPRQLIAVFVAIFAVFGAYVIFHSLAATPPGTFYVDQDSIGGQCSDSYSTDQAEDAKTPWCTIHQAFKLAPSASTVNVRAGNYPFQDLNGDKTHGGRVQQPTDFITFQPYGYGGSSPEKVTINGVKTNNTAYLRFQGFSLTGSDNTPAGLISAFFAYLNTDHMQIINNDITGEGVRAQGSTNILIKGNNIHDTMRNCSINLFGDGGGIFAGGLNGQILNNHIWNTVQDAMDPNGTNVLVEGNIVEHIKGGDACGDHTDFAQLDNHASGPITFRNNYFNDGTEFILRNVVGLTIENNVIVGMDGWMQLAADPGAKVINNTFWGGNGCSADGKTGCTGAGSLLLRDYGPGDPWTKPPFNYTNHMDGSIVKNNILRLMGTSAGVTVDNNLVYGPHDNCKKQADGTYPWPGCIQGPNSLFGMPTFVNAAAGDFHLVSGSLGINAGDPTVAPSTDYDGLGRNGAPDIGAYEFGGTGTQNPSPTPPATPPSNQPPSGGNNAGNSGNSPVVGDLNDDGHVNIYDINLFLNSYNKRRGGKGYMTNADLNNDGVVNIYDLSLLLSKYGK